VGLKYAMEGYIKDFKINMVADKIGFTDHNANGISLMLQPWFPKDSTPIPMKMKSLKK